MGATDDDLLRMLEETEQAQDRLDHTLHTTAETHIDADPCPYCGEPAQHLGQCHTCHEDGCLPPDLWTPGMNDPCLTLCVRCARTIHHTCTREDAAGNPTCPTCKY